MALVCDNCGKGMVYGRQSTHHRGVAGKRWRKRAQRTLRTFKPNLQKIAVMVGGLPAGRQGKKVQMKLCTNCIKLFKKEGKLASIRKTSLVASA